MKKKHYLRMKCPICGRIFETGPRRHKVCSRRCGGELGRRAFKESRAALAAEGKKPYGMSAVRWRIEQRRRADPDKYAICPPPCAEYGFAPCREGVDLW